MTKAPWNKGKSVGQKKPFTEEQTTMLKTLLTNKGEIKELALFSLGIDTILRAGDLLSLKVEDVLDHQGNPTLHINIQQEKTTRPHIVKYSAKTGELIKQLIKSQKKRPQDYLFTFYQKKTPMKRVSYSRMIKKWSGYLGLDKKNYATHSGRRTNSSLLFKKTKNLKLVQEVMGHKNINSTVQYLNIDRDEAWSKYEEEFLK